MVLRKRKYECQYSNPYDKAKILIEIYRREVRYTHIVGVMVIRCILECTVVCWVDTKEHELGNNMFGKGAIASFLSISFTAYFYALCI